MISVQEQPKMQSFEEREQKETLFTPLITLKQKSNKKKEKKHTWYLNTCYFINKQKTHKFTVKIFFKCELRTTAVLLLEVCLWVWLWQLLSSIWKKEAEI